MKRALQIFILILTVNQLSAQDYHPYKEREKLAYNGYQYSIFPGTEAWRALEMNADKHALLQLPNDTLRAISTQRLVETCLYYPMMMDVLAFDNLVQGFHFIRGKFNGFEELYRRPDAASCLLLYYQQRNPNRITIFEESTDRGRFSLDFFFLELMIAQQEIMTQLETSQIRLLTQIVLQKLEQQSALPQNYSRVFIPISALVVGRIIAQAGVFPPEPLQSATSQFLETGVLENPQDISSIFEQAQLFIQN